jgi:signal transduction histidine kinase
MTHPQLVGEQRESYGARQDDALAQLRHDLRQYVAAGLLLTQFPGDALLKPEVRQRLGRLRELFTQMSELTAPDSAALGSVRPTAATDLVALVGECVSLVRISRDVAVDVVGVGPVHVDADAAMLRRAVNNVLDNAARAAGESGTVCVRVGAAGGEALVEVADDGDGFGRIPSQSGQGMAVVDQALRMCRGRLEISSGPGPGTTVRLRIPTRASGRSR